MRLRTGWNRARFTLLALAAAALTGCGGAGQAADTGDPATLGQRTFMQWCAPCHGAEGEGNINALAAPPLNAAGDTFRLTDAEILDGIVKGGTQEGSNMQPLGEFLTAEQQMAEAINFSKNVAIFGGLMFLVAWGPGSLSVDGRGANTVAARPLP